MASVDYPQARDYLGDALAMKSRTANLPHPPMVLGLSELPIYFIYFPGAATAPDLSFLRQVKETWESKGHSTYPILYVSEDNRILWGQGLVNIAYSLPSLTIDIGAELQLKGIHSSVKPGQIVVPASKIAGEREVFILRRQYESILDDPAFNMLSEWHQALSKCPVMLFRWLGDPKALKLHIQQCMTLG